VAEAAEAQSKKDEQLAALKKDQDRLGTNTAEKMPFSTVRKMDPRNVSKERSIFSSLRHQTIWLRDNPDSLLGTHTHTHAHTH
jgi:hypothetical protein